MKPKFVLPIPTIMNHCHWNYFSLMKKIKIIDVILKIKLHIRTRF